MAGAAGAEADDGGVGNVGTVPIFVDCVDVVAFTPLGLGEAALEGGVPPGGFLAISVLILLHPEPLKASAGNRAAMVNALAEQIFMSATNQEHLEPACAIPASIRLNLRWKTRKRCDARAWCQARAWSTAAFFCSEQTQLPERLIHVPQVRLQGT